MDVDLITGFTRLAGFFRPVNPVNLVNPVVKVSFFVPCVSTAIEFPAWLFPEVSAIKKPCQP
jgi:hypothetical protein